MLDDLLRALDALDLDDDAGGVIAGFTRHGSDVTLTVHLGNVYSLETAETWSVECRDVRDYQLVCGAIDTPVELLDDVPELWVYLHPSALLYCVGVEPEQADAALGALYRAHMAAVGRSYDSLPFGPGLNTTTSLRGGSGLVARGPLPLLQAYDAALSGLGITTSIIGERMPEGYSGDARREAPRLLTVGPSWVVAQSFEARRLDVPPTPPAA